MDMKKFSIFMKNYIGHKWTTVAPVIYLVCRYVAHMSLADSLKSAAFVLVFVYFLLMFTVVMGVSSIRRLYTRGGLYICIHGKGKLFKNLGYYYLEDGCTLKEVSKGYGHGKNKIVSGKFDTEEDYQIISEPNDGNIHVVKIR